MTTNRNVRLKGQVQSRAFAWCSSGWVAFYEAMENVWLRAFKKNVPQKLKVFGKCVHFQLKTCFFQFTLFTFLLMQRTT